MAVAFLFGLICGIVFGCRYRVFVLIPAHALGILVTVCVAALTGACFHAVVGFIVWSLAVQASYAAMVVAAPWFRVQPVTLQRT